MMCSEQLQFSIPIPNRKEEIALKRKWERNFQKWCDQEQQKEETYYGHCGNGLICDYRDGEFKGHPCVRALNYACRERNIKIDYNNENYVDWWNSLGGQNERVDKC